MADSKSAYSKASKRFVEEHVPASALNQGRYDRSKAREREYNENWCRQKVNINDIVDQFAPGSSGIAKGVKYIFKGPLYTVVADMASGYLRIKDNKSKQYLKLDGTHGDSEATHFKIKKKEEM